MTYSVKEIFYTLQGEGLNAGRAAVFCRFAGCNLWSGLERDRDQAICQFCDTEFVGTDGTGGGKFETAKELAEAVQQHWDDQGKGPKFVVCTGGEPLLQMDEALIRAFHDRGFEIAVETNGTIEVPDSIDWICVSPKAGSDLLQQNGQELKLVYPQAGNSPEEFVDLEFDAHLLQPMDSPAYSENLEAAIRYCMAHPKWRLSLQTHKLMGIR